MRSSDGSKCVCTEGFYDPDGDGPRTECIPCEPGFACTQGQRTPCPPHTYQPAPQATACINCASTRDSDGIYSNCGSKKQLQHCAAGQSALTCTPCAQCSKAYLTSSVANQVGCYKSH